MLLSTCTLSTLLGKYCTFIIQIMTRAQYYFHHRWKVVVYLYLQLSDL